MLTSIGGRWYEDRNACPYCSNKKVRIDNCLETVIPKLSKEWHPTKIGLITPNQVIPSSNKKAWWLCKLGHEWEGVIASRNLGRGCLECYKASSKRVEKNPTNFNKTTK